MMTEVSCVGVKVRVLYGERMLRSIGVSALGASGPYASSEIGLGLALGKD